MTTRHPRSRLVVRLLAANGLVIAAGSVTLAVVALLVSPALFRRHVGPTIGPVTDVVGRHLDEALTTALLLSLGIAMVIAAVVAAVVSWVLSSRLARPIEDLSAAADRVAHGDLTARAPRPPVDDELAVLTIAFNDMAAALQHSEVTRRRLLSDLAHELRTPLSTVEGYLEGLVDGVVDPDPETFTTLQQAAGRLRRLVDDVAVVSRAEEGQLELERRVVEPGELVHAAVAAMRDAYVRADVRLEVDTAPDLPAVEVDPERIHQVLSNLLDNARRHTPRGGRVEVRGERRDGHVVITVEDSGDGIPADQLPHVFERFYRGDAARTSGTGTGIGLTIARGIARSHGGTLTAHSAGHGRGSAFTLRLPSTS